MSWIQGRPVLTVARGIDSMASMSTPESPARKASPVIVDFGKKKKKQIKRLLKGKGKLMDAVHDCVGELKSAGKVDESAAVVVIVVREKDEPRRGLPIVLPRF